MTYSCACTYEHTHAFEWKVMTMQETIIFQKRGERNKVGFWWIWSGSLFQQSWPNVGGLIQEIQKMMSEVCRCELSWIERWRREGKSYWDTEVVDFVLSEFRNWADEVQHGQKWYHRLFFFTRDEEADIEKLKNVEGRVRKTRRTITSLEVTSDGIRFRIWLMAGGDNIFALKLVCNTSLSCLMRLYTSFLR